MSTQARSPRQEFMSALGLAEAEVVSSCAGAPTELATTIAAAEPRALLIACPQEAEGRELLLWLRLEHKLLCPILLGGFRSEEDVRAAKENRPERFLIHAPGNRYVQLPVPRDQWPELKQWLDRSAISEEKLSTEYGPYLRAGFEIDKIRHGLANKFGLGATWDIHHIAAGGLPDYPAKLKVEFNKDKALRIARSLFPVHTTAVRVLVAKRTADLTAELDQLAADYRTLVDRIAKQEIAHEEALQLYQELMVRKEMLEREASNVENDGATTSEFQDRAVERGIELEETAITAAGLKEAVELDQMAAEDVFRSIADLKNDYSELLEEIRNDIVRSPLPPIRRHLRVLHVDDELELGWDQLMRRVIDGAHANPPNYRPLQPTSKKVEVIKKQVLDAIAAPGPPLDVVLLDLRLMGEQGAQFDAAHPPSGIQVLRAIRAKHKTLPVIVTTASNKMWSYRTVMRDGADAYWMKQGVELGWGHGGTFDNYIELRRMLAATVDPLVSSARKMERLLHWMGMPHNQWWSNGKWENGRDERLGDTDGAMELLVMAISELRGYIQRRVFQSADTIIVRQWEVSPVCTRLGCVAERIIAPEKEYYSIADAGPNRSIDVDFKNAIRIRNKASHGKAAEGQFRIDHKRLGVQVDCLNRWLKGMGRNGSGTL